MPRILAASLALGLLLAGCGAEASPRAREPQPHRTSAPGPASSSARTTPTTTAATAATPRRPVASRPPRPARSDDGGLTVTRADAPDAHLLTVDAWGPSWSVTGTGPEEGVVSRCHRASMRDIGAEEAMLRGFARTAEADGPGAHQVVARFADRRSAWRAERVVGAWRDDCTRDLRRRHAALGALRHGSWVSVVEVAGVRRPQRRLDRALAAVGATFG